MARRPSDKVIDWQGRRERLGCKAKDSNQSGGYPSDLPRQRVWRATAGHYSALSQTAPCLSAGHQLIEDHQLIEAWSCRSRHAVSASPREGVACKGQTGFDHNTLAPDFRNARSKSSRLDRRSAASAVRSMDRKNSLERNDGQGICNHNTTAPR